MSLVTREDYISTYDSDFHGKKYADKHSEWFPVERSCTLAGLIGDLTTDGHVQGYNKLRFEFTASSKEKPELFENRPNKLFALKHDIRENKTNPYSTSFNYGVNSKPLTRILIECGAPTDCKVKTKFNIPR